MIRDDLIIGKTRTLLDEFLTPMQAPLDKPRRRFLRRAVRGIVLSGTLVVMELCRWIQDNRSDRFYQDKRLLLQYHSRQVGTQEIVLGSVDLPRRTESLHLVALWRPGRRSGP